MLAIVLSVAVLVVFSIVQGVFFAPPPPQIAAPPGDALRPVAPPIGQVIPADDPPPVAQVDPGVAADPPALPGDPIEDAAPQFEQLVHINTDFVSVVLTNAGGNIQSFRLNRHRDGDENVEMIFSGDGPANAFAIAFGGAGEPPQTVFFNVIHTPGTHTVIFYRYFALPNRPDARFRLEKEYRFHPGEYMFELVVRLDGGHLVQGFDFGGAAYTLSFGPQIGPRFQTLAGRRGMGGHGDYRDFFTFHSGGRNRPSTERANALIATRPQWAAIAGQYFTLIAIPLLHASGFDLLFSEAPEPGVPSASRMHIIRPPIASSRAEDVFRFYLGPRSLDILQAYDRGDSAFIGASGLNLAGMAGSMGFGFLAPLERLLLWLLTFFYGMTGNYGIAILLLTLLVRIVLFPLSFRGTKATMPMQAMAPKIKELQEKYKDNRQKLNMEMMELYKREGYSPFTPLKGCLPMLLQFPIFIAMFNLFRTHFDLRGAMFIPGWIPDLSVAEYIWAFPSDIRLPIVGWTAIRLLPFIQAGTQILSMKVMQTPDQKANNQMRMIMYLMPVIFFFVLYDMPSGLLVYWIFTNLLMMIQQVAVMKYLRKKKAAAQPAAEPASAVVAPQKKKSGQGGVIAPVKTPPRKKKKR